MKPMEPKEVIKCDVLKELHVHMFGEKNKTVLRIVKWNTSDKPCLENRRFYFTIDYDEWRPMKMAPIGAEEFKVILENKDLIKSLLGEVGDSK